MRDKYKLKENKKAFLYPAQWRKFYDSLKEKQQPYFKIAINTGGRVNEILNVCPKDINEERKQLIFRVTKIKAKKHERRPNPRTIAISDELCQWLKRWRIKNNLQMNEPFVNVTKVAIDKSLKQNLKKIGVENWYDYSSHNIRKTHGNWLKAIGVDGVEIASRLGHDMNTMVGHYVSSNLFNEADKVLIKQELGSLCEVVLPRQQYIEVRAV